MILTILRSLRTAFRGALLLSILSAAASVELSAQEVTLELTPSATDLSGCADDELRLTLRLLNPGMEAIGGYQAFLKFPAEQFELVAYEDSLDSENSYVQAPAPLGDGFRPCTTTVDDPWDDGEGSDMVSVIVSLIENQGGEVGPFDAAAADLGQFVFRTTGVPSGEEGVTFQTNTTDCHPPFDQRTKVFSPGGETLSSLDDTLSATVVVSDSDPQLRFFDCEARGTDVELFWGFPEDERVAGVRLYRNGEQIANILLTTLTSFVDDEVVSGEAVYEAAILLVGDLEQEGCRLSCSLGFRFIRGDANGDGRINLTDSVSILGHLFQGMPLECADSGDFNDNGEVNLTDVVAVLEYLFQPGVIVPPPPFPNPGLDPTSDGLVCG